MRWLHLRFRAPLAAFGGEAVDARGVIRRFPARSMLTGLLGNAMGWERSMHAELQRLQDRLIFGAADRSGPTTSRMTDYQTAQLNKDDRAWTTRGQPSGRAGGPATYAGAHQRWRDYHADMHVEVVVRFEPDSESPTIEELAYALERPARPLFIGRKSCLPSAPVFAGYVDAPDARSALVSLVPSNEEWRGAWPESEGIDGSDRVRSLTDERNWVTGLHVGMRRVCEGRLVGSRENG